MKKIALVFLAFVAFSCENNLKKPVDTASSVSPEEISLGGIVAELKDSVSSNLSISDGEVLFAPQIKQMMEQLESIKSARKSLDGSGFSEHWDQLNHEVLLNQQKLTEVDVNKWIALNDSLLKYSEDVRFADVLEQTVFNNLGKYRFGANQLKSFFYTRRYDRIYVNLFGSSSMQYEHTTGGSVRLVQSTDYPFDGQVTISFELQDKRFLDLFVRIPEWANYAAVNVKGVKYPVTFGQYAEVARMWENGDKAEIVIGFNPIVVKRDEPNKAFALSYGPLWLSYVKTGNDSLVYAGDDPVTNMRFVSPLGEMPTFTFTGIPNHTVVYQPLFAEGAARDERAIWMNEK